MDMDDRTKQTFQAATDALKQIMTLSTGILTLEITFLKEIIVQLPRSGYWWLGLSWVCFLLALIFGIWGLLTVTGTLGRNEENQEKEKQLSPHSIYDLNIVIPTLGQLASFLIGMVFTAVFGVVLLWNKYPS